MASNLITNPYTIMLSPTGGGGRAKPIANGQFYYGVIDQDPLLNPIQVYYKDEAGAEVKIDQPIRTNNSGAFVANDGQTLINPYTKFSGYSTLAKNANGDTIYEDRSVGDAGNINDTISNSSSFTFDSVIDAKTVPNSKAISLNIGDTVGCNDYYGGASPSGSGVLIFKVVAPGTGPEDGGKRINASDGSFQLEQILKKPYNIQAWGASPSALATENDAAISACIAYAGQQEYVIIPNKIDQVKGNVYIPSGRYPATKIDTPDGVLPEGDSATSSILVDEGTDTSRAFVEVGGAGREYNRCGLSKIGLLGNKVTDRNGVRFTKTYRMSGLFDCAVDDFYNNVVGEDFFAAAFINNRIYSAVNDNFSIVNGTSTYWERNRIELAGRHNVSIDGESAQEPISLSFNGDKIQSAGGSGIHGVDVLSVELNSVFIESNNQLGTYNHVNFVGGTSSNERGTLLVSGGFITPGSGGTGTTALNVGNMKTVCLMPAFIRGNFNEGLRLGSDVDNAMIFGEIDGPVTPVVIPENVEYIRALRGGRIELNGFLSQKSFRRHRTIASNTNSQSLDSLVFMNTSSGNVIYTVRTADIEDGREIALQKTTGDGNRIVIRTEGSEPVNGDPTEVFFTEAYKRVTITCVGGSVFVG